MVMSDSIEPNQPYVPPPPSGPRLVFPTLALADPFRWLRLGAMDLRRHAGIGLFYGACFWTMYALLHFIFLNAPEYTISMASGCLLAGPFLAMGLYDVSRRRERGLPVLLLPTMTCWTPNLRSLGMLVFVLLVLELLWGRISLVVFAVFFNTGMPSTTGVIEAIFNPENLEFVIAYTCVGGFFAGLVFVFSVVSIPMIHDRNIDAITATIASFQTVLTSPIVWLLWGAIITAIIVASMWFYGLGLVLFGPLIGHATWHAYRAAVQWPPGE